MRVLLSKNGKNGILLPWKSGREGMGSFIIVWAMSVVNGLCQRQIVDKAFDKPVDNFGLVSV